MRSGPDITRVQERNCVAWCHMWSSALLYGAVCMIHLEESSYEKFLAMGADTYTRSFRSDVVGTLPWLPIYERSKEDAHMYVARCRDVYRFANASV